MIAALFLLLACSSGDEPASETAPVSPPATASEVPDTSLYQLPSVLVDQHGQSVGLDVHEGHPTIVGMFYASCPMACPLMIQDLSSVEARLDPAERAKLRVLLISLQPEVDSPQTLTKVVETHGLDQTRWRLTRPEPEDVRHIAAVLGIQYRPLADGEMHHTTVLTLVDAQGAPVTTTSQVRKDGDRFVAAIRETLQ